MSNDQTATFNNHDTSNCLSNSESNKCIKLNLRWNDQQKGLDKLYPDQQFLSTTKIFDIIVQLIKIANLEQIRPENVTFKKIVHDKSYDDIPSQNSHLTLDQLQIVDDCTLCFEPFSTPITEEGLQLTMWYEDHPSREVYVWHKSTTTLNMLIEYLMDTFSLKSIERHRIHIFYKSYEIDIESDCNKLLAQLGIVNHSFINFKVIPPIPNSEHLANKNTLAGYPKLNDLDGFHDIFFTDYDKQIKLTLHYTDVSKDVTKCIDAQFSTLSDIFTVKHELLKRCNLEQLRQYEVDLISVNRDSNFTIPEKYEHKTLNELEIIDGCHLYFEPSCWYFSNVMHELAIIGPDGEKRVDYGWCKTSTTLGQLLDYVIKEFSLESVERQYICLSRYANEKFDHISNSDRLLSDLDIKEFDIMSVKIIKPDSFLSDNENQNIYIDCAYLNGNIQLYVSPTITIDQLKTEIGKQPTNNIVPHLKLFDRMHNKINMNDSDRTLESLDIRPGHTIYAAIHSNLAKTQTSTLNSRIDTVRKTSSLITKYQPDEVQVVYQTEKKEPWRTMVSINGTVGDLIQKIKVHTNNRRLDQIEICCGTIEIDAKETTRHLHDFGIKSGDIIDVTAKEIVYKLGSPNPDHFTSTATLNILPRSQSLYCTPVGLANLANTCYMNSALQCLAHAKPLTQFFLDRLTQDTSDDNKIIANEWNRFYDVGTVTGAYADVLKNLWLPKKTSLFLSTFHPTCMKDVIGNLCPRFATCEQQDAQEYMTLMLDEMHKEFKKQNNESDTIIEDLFFGKIQSTTTCTECQHQEKTISPISFIPLPIIEGGRIFSIKFITKRGEYDMVNVTVADDSPVKSLIQAFGDARPHYDIFYTIIAMTNDELLDLEMPLNKLSTNEITLIEQDDMAFPRQYDRYQRNSKKISLEQCLKEFFSVEHLEDSWFCPQETCKVHRKTTKQLELCSLPTILIIQFKRFANNNGLREKIEMFIEYPKDGLDLSAFLPPSSEEAIYDLFAVCKHTGTIAGGHYIACAKHEENNITKWYKFDDSIVSSFCHDDDIVSKDAYLLFYIRRNKSQPSTTVATSIYV